MCIIAITADMDITAISTPSLAMPSINTDLSVASTSTDIIMAAVGETVPIEENNFQSNEAINHIVDSVTNIGSQSSATELEIKQTIILDFESERNVSIESSHICKESPADNCQETDKHYGTVKEEVLSQLNAVIDKQPSSVHLSMDPDMRDSSVHALVDLEKNDSFHKISNEERIKSLQADKHSLEERNELLKIKISGKYVRN